MGPVAHPLSVVERRGARERTSSIRARSAASRVTTPRESDGANGTEGALLRRMLDAVLATAVMMVSASFVGFGAVAAALAGPHKLVIVAMMLMMIAASSRPADLDL